MDHVALQHSIQPPMYIVAIAWLYVALMMAVAEATNTTGTVLGALFTFLLYGIAPVALLVYIMRTPARKQAIRERERAAQQQADEMRAAAAASGKPDGGGEAPAGAVAPVRKEP